MSHSAVEGRLAALQRHLSAGLNLSNGEIDGCKVAGHDRHSHAHLTILQHVVQAGLELQQTKSAGAQRPAPGGGAGSLTVVDNRTGKKYEIKVGT